MSYSNDPTTWSVKRLSDEISSRQVSPVDVVEAFLNRIATHDDKLHSYSEVYAHDARLAAEAADKAIRSGHAVGPLHGIPIAIKDAVELQGRVTTGGCSIWRDRKSTFTGTLAQRLLAQGMIVLGKTHMVEFALGGWGTNTQMGTPWNPWDLKTARTPGGSSSGSGVAVAAGLTPWAVGTDTGGSVRLPASWCGLTALKTSAGRISNYGVLPLSTTLDTPGPMAQDAIDTAMLYQAMQGPDLMDRRTLGLPIQNIEDTLHRGISGLRLARMPDSERANVTPAVLAAYDRSLDELAELGAKIVSIDLPCGFADVAALNGIIMAAESYAVLSDIVDDADQKLDEDVRPRILAGRDITAHNYLSALRERSKLILRFDQIFSEIDALLTPTTIRTALPLNEIDQTTAPSHFTRFANFLDLCALAMPNGADDGGLPISLQVMTRRFDEAKALQIACAYQKATNWHTRRPTL